MKIYLLEECYDYKGSTVIKAYVSQDAAEEAKRLCEEYKSKFNWETWDWHAPHPFGDLVCSSADGYTITDTELVE